MSVYRLAFTKRDRERIAALQEAFTRALGAPVSKVDALRMAMQKAELALGAAPIVRHPTGAPKTGG